MQGRILHIFNFGRFRALLVKLKPKWTLDMKPDQYLPIKRVSGIVGKGKSSIWEGVRKGKFPQPIKIGGSTRWKLSELEAYLNQLSAQRISK